MRHLFLIVILFTGINAQSQITLNESRSCLKKVELIQLNNTDVDFIFVYVNQKIFSYKTTCTIDYGQKRRIMHRKSKVRQDNGDIMHFNSEADILNYLIEKGWLYLEYDPYAYIFKGKKK